MDDRRFDDLTRLLGAGQSRRKLLRGVLGLAAGGITTGTVSSDADARALRTRPTIPPPPSPSCKLPSQQCGGVCCEPGKCKEGHCCPNATDAWCGDRCWPEALCTANGSQCDEGERVCGAICCDESAACTRSGNSDTCCDPATNAPCGLECCPSALQCCDGECCAGTDICLQQAFPGSPFVEEEVCCPAEQTCDQRCCEGTCFTPLGTMVSGSDRTCCPPESNVCPGSGDFTGEGLCCAGETSRCCHNVDGSPVCVSEAQCCTHQDCGGLTNPAECLEGVCEEFECFAETLCVTDTRCCEGGDNVCCHEDQECCGPVCCDAGLECCGATVDGVLQQTCIDPLTDCCAEAHCVELGFAAECVTCNIATHSCVAANNNGLCNNTECATCQNRQCVDTHIECPCQICRQGTCSDVDCTNGGDVCCSLGEVCNLNTRTCETVTTTTGGPGTTTTNGPTTTTTQTPTTTTTGGPGTTTTGAPRTTTTTGGPGTSTTVNPCENEGGTPCGNNCCRAQCCQNLSGPTCVGVEEQCCDTEADCANLNRCVRDTANQLFHEHWTCGPRGVCVSELAPCQDNNACTQNTCSAAIGCSFPPIICDDGNLCTTSTCNAANGACVHTPLPTNTTLVQGVCCAGGVLKPRGTVCCTGFSDCASLPDLPCMRKVCTGGVCDYESTCFPFVECETATCVENTCMRQINCGSLPTGLGIGASCSRGCQCSSRWCANESGDGRCRQGGTGSNFDFCP